MEKRDNFTEMDCQTCKNVTTTACQQCLSYSAWLPAVDLKNLCESCTNAGTANIDWCDECAFKNVESKEAPVDMPQDDDYVEVPDVEAEKEERMKTVAKELDTLADLEAELSAVNGVIKELPDDGSMKHDTGKTPWEYLEWDLMEEIATARLYGIKKYGNPMGWKLVDKAKSRYFAALLRHWRLMNAGEIYDKEAEELMGMKVTHRGMFMCNAMFIAAFYRDEPDVPMETVRK